MAETTDRRRRSDYRHFERLRVRWSEIDQQQIVFNGHYLTYFDVAIAGYWRSLHLPYADSMAMLDGDMVLRKATVDYLASARYDDVLDVGMRAGRIGNSSLLFEGTVFRGEEPLVDGELVYVFVAPHVFTPRPVPAPFREALRAFEAGEPMLEVRLGSWSEMQADAGPLRTRVFVEEQGVPAEIELDAADADAVHAVARNRLGAAAGHRPPAGRRRSAGAASQGRPHGRRPGRPAWRCWPPRPGRADGRRPRPRRSRDRAACPGGGGDFLSPRGLQPHRRAVRGSGHRPRDDAQGALIRASLRPRAGATGAPLGTAGHDSGRGAVHGAAFPRRSRP
jgi:YbgC/YbaW family acyl-CoA thioester hydrolase